MPPFSGPRLRNYCWRKPAPGLNDRHGHWTLHEATELARNMSAKQVQTEADAYKEHIAIYDAIAAKNPWHARRSIRLELTGSLKRMDEAASWS